MLSKISSCDTASLSMTSIVGGLTLALLISVGSCENYNKCLKLCTDVEDKSICILSCKE